MTVFSVFWEGGCGAGGKRFFNRVVKGSATGRGAFRPSFIVAPRPPCHAAASELDRCHFIPRAWAAPPIIFIPILRVKLRTRHKENRIYETGMFQLRSVTPLFEENLAKSDPLAEKNDASVACFFCGILTVFVGNHIMVSICNRPV